MSSKPLKSPPTAPYQVPNTGRTTLTDQQIAQAAYNAGFRGQALATAVAVALAESHGNTTALNDHGEFSVGMFQINVNGYLAQRLKNWGYSSWTDLWDPEKNAAAAYKISGGGRNFGLWSTYKHGTYLKYMDRATAAAKTVDPNGAPVGGGFNVVYNPSAVKLIQWMETVKYTDFASWSDAVDSATKFDASAGSYLASILTALNVPLADKPSEQVAMQVVTQAQNESNPNPFDPLGGITGVLSGLGSFAEGLVGGISHAFIFLVIIIIGLVFVMASFKVRPTENTE